jgi:hypothetical protein
MVAPPSASIPLPRGYIDGLILANGTDSDHDINISTGECRDSTNLFNLANTATLVKQIDAAWAAGSAAGGLFSGAVGNATWYHVFLIRKDSDGTIDAGFDTSVSAANRPAGYSTYRRIGSVLTNGSANIIAFSQTNDLIMLKSPAFDANAAAWGSSRTLVTLSVPTGVITYPKVAAFALKGATSLSLWIGPPEVTDVAAGLGIYNSYTPSAGAATYSLAAGEVGVRANTSAQIAVRSDTAGVTGYLITYGWIDPRGKDA